MQKIPNVFVRDWNGDKSRVLNEAEPASAWVLAGEGMATRKWDGTACLVAPHEGTICLFKRYDAKGGKPPPHGFLPAQDPDPATGHWPGWLEVQPNKPEDRWHVEAWIEQRRQELDLSPGTYELCGPKISANPEGFPVHVFVRHGIHLCPDVPRSYDGMYEWLARNAMEGLVFHHPDGRMSKVKRRDFGLPWPVERASE